MKLTAKCDGKELEEMQITILENDLSNKLYKLRYEASDGTIEIKNEEGVIKKLSQDEVYKKIREICDE